MFDFEWTMGCDADEADMKKGIDAAEEYCAKNNIDPEELYTKLLKAIENEEDLDDHPLYELWNDIEYVAVKAMCEGWYEMAENVTLIWR